MKNYSISCFSMFLISLVFILSSCEKEKTKCEADLTAQIQEYNNFQSIDEHSSVFYVNTFEHIQYLLSFGFIEVCTFSSMDFFPVVYLKDSYDNLLLDFSVSWRLRDVDGNVGYGWEPSTHFSADGTTISSYNTTGINIPAKKQNTVVWVECKVEVGYWQYDDIWTKDEIHEIMKNNIFDRIKVEFYYHKPNY